jgi:hypothetical protein
MADENQELNTEVNDEVVDNTEVDNSDGNQESTLNEGNYTEVEQRAMEQGWVPKDQWDGHGKWRSAEEFLDRGELFAKIDEVKRHNKQMEGTVHALKKHLDMVRRTEYNRALATLRAEKKNALAEGDADAVVEIEDRIDQLKASTVQAEMEAQRQAQAMQQPDYDPVVQVWINKNPWYQNDPAMKIYADQIGHQLAASGTMDARQVLLEVERRTKKEFAHKFQNPNRAKAGMVESGGNKGKSKADDFQLTAEETLVMNKFVKAKVMTKEEYIKEIKAARGK